MTALKWYCFRTVSQYEFRAENLIRNAGFQVFVPREYRIIRRRQGSGREARSKAYPMLVSYLLVGFDRPVNWFRMFDGKAGFGNILTGVVGYEGKPQPIPEEGIRHLERISQEFVPYRDAPQTRRSIMAGEQVVFDDGPFAGLEGKVESINGTDATVWVEFLNSIRSVNVPVATITAA